MKSLNVILIIFLFLLIPNLANAEEITLFDFNGRVIAYIDTDDELTIYMWAGKPVAYLEHGSIWGFNGKHLGWFKQGIIWGHDGYAAGFIEGAVNVVIEIEPIIRNTANISNKIYSRN